MKQHTEEYLRADVADPSGNEHHVTQYLEDGVRVTVFPDTAHAWKLLKHPLVRLCMLIVVVFEPLLWIRLKMQGLPAPLELRHFLWPFYGVAGVYFMFGNGSLLRTTVTYEATSKGLGWTYEHLLKRQYCFWPRDEIAALRPVGSIDYEGAWHVGLELQTRENKRITFGGRDAEFLRYLATLLRRALKVPATAPDVDQVPPKTFTCQAKAAPGVA